MSYRMIKEIIDTTLPTQFVTMYDTVHVYNHTYNNYNDYTTLAINIIVHT